VIKELELVLDNIDKILIGHRHSAKLLLAVCLAKGHVLIEDQPGVGKTMLVKGLASSLDCKFSRIQFNSDILPSDIAGLEIYNRDGEYKFIKGPIMANIVLVDEINRGNPRAQAGLLEAMEEKQVTVMGKKYKLHEPFCVMATQNPEELVGTFPLSEGILDRFMAHLSLGYPGPKEELEMLNLKETCDPLSTLGTVITQEQLLKGQAMVKDVMVEASVKRYIVDVVQYLRYRKELSTGLSPRATLDLYNLCRSWALLQKRDFVIPDDVKYLASRTLGHRIFLRNEARFQGTLPSNLVEDALNTVSVPVARR